MDGPGAGKQPLRLSSGRGEPGRVAVLLSRVVAQRWCWGEPPPPLPPQVSPSLLGLATSSRDAAFPC